MTAEATPKVTRTNDMAAVRALGVACGLEDSERDAEDIVAAWGAWVGTRLVGAIVLERDHGLDVVNWLSVDAEFRGRGLAGGLYAELEREARGRGVRRLLVTARAPGFFARQDFIPLGTGPESRHLLRACTACRQYGRTCRPQAFHKDLGESSALPGGSS
jgi:GNAT superfamily N-acetyltransferase